MNRRREAFLQTITILVFFLFLPQIVTAQASSPTPAEIEACEALLEKMKRAADGRLTQGGVGLDVPTPVEIEACRELLEQIKGEAEERPPRPIERRVEEERKIESEREVLEPLKKDVAVPLEDKELSKAIKELLRTHPDWTDQQITNEASKLLETYISRNSVSRIRTEKEEEEFFEKISITKELLRTYPDWTDQQIANEASKKLETYISRSAVARIRARIRTEKTEQEEEEYFEKIAVPEPPPLEIFGHKLFLRPPSTFAPIKTMPISDEYVIGSGDEIGILMWGRLDASYRLEVDNEGVINFPKIGPLIVAGLTFRELKALIKVKAEAITGVNVNVSMGKLRTIQVFVLGDVKSPGVYTVSSIAPLSNALLSSGGPTPLGSLRRVELKRKRKVIATIDVYDFLLKGDKSQDVRLDSGDIIFVPQAGPMVSVTGNVKRPAIYELKHRETLKTVLRLAGGLKPRASNQRIQIERAYENRVQIVLDVSYEELRRKKAIKLHDGDVVRIFPILPTPINAVYLYGNVLRPGQYEYKPELRILDILPNLKVLNEDTYFDYALIKRYRSEEMAAELIPFNLGGLLLSRDMTQNIPLMPKDEVYIFNKRMFEEREYATVNGEVRKPGRYFIDNMRVKDLILKAGNLTDEAYLPKAEIIRIDRDQNRHTIYFDVAAAIADNVSHNIIVRHKDRVIVHSIWEERWKEFVTITGEVKKAGEYTLTKGMRLKDLFFKAGRFSRDAFMEMGHLYRTDRRTKEVTIHTFQLKKALEEDPEHNLLLEDLDGVVIHSIWEYVEKDIVTIEGMVNKPGDYPYATNMTVRDLILVSGNVKYAAYMKTAELIRYDIVEGARVQTSVINFDVRLALRRDPAHNLKLNPQDVVHIKEVPEWGEKKAVTISGEVNFPGTYPVRRDERLSSVIARAGGYTEEAYLRGGIFTRESVRVIQQDRLNTMMRRLEIEIADVSAREVQTALSEEDIAAQAQFVAAQRALIAALRKVTATGRVVISLKYLHTFKGTSGDLIMEDGDRLYVPPKPTTINILGEVYNPTALVYNVERSRVKDYLAKVGGPTENAEKDQMYIIRVDGTVVSKKSTSWFSFGKRFKNIKLLPGDTLLVPQKVARPSYLRDVKDITQILYQIAVTTGVVIALF
jgi:protein involved in polysaccharide export with SLBB domain